MWKITYPESRNETALPRNGQMLNHAHSVKALKSCCQSCACARINQHWKMRGALFASWAGEPVQNQVPWANTCQFSPSHCCQMTCLRCGISDGEANICGFDAVIDLWRILPAKACNLKTQSQDYLEASLDLLLALDFHLFVFTLT